MKTLLACILLVTSFASTVSGGQSLSVVATFVNLYASPSFETVLADASGQAYTFEHGTIFQAIEEDGDFILVRADVEDQTIEGYVYKYYVTTNENGQDVYPVFNGSVTLDGAIIYDINGNPTQHSAKLGQGITIYGGFDDQNEFTSLAIVLEDGSLFYGMMRTQDIAPYGISGALIASITIIVALVTIILSVIFIRKKRSKKK